MQRRQLLHLTLASSLFATLLTGCSKKAKLPAIAKGATVLALGDSLTEGVGTSPQTAYPEVLAAMTGWNVINAGVSGDTSAGALSRLAGLLSKHQPKLVLTCIGGNDFLHQVDESRTRSNIKAICEKIKASNAQNMLIAVPKISLLAATLSHLSDHPMYQQIAKETDIPLQEGGWSEVLSNASLRSDRIHANKEGYALFAQRLAKSLRDVGLLV